MSLFLGMVAGIIVLIPLTIFFYIRIEKAKKVAVQQHKQVMAKFAADTVDYQIELAAYNKKYNL